MKKMILFLLVFAGVSFAQDISGSFSTGFRMGTPYWNSDNYSKDNVIDVEDSFMRTLNQLRLNGKFGENFKIRFNALRSDGMQSENRLSETKIYQVYGQYDFSGGHVKLGRFVPFNRWLWGSVDGGAGSYAFTPNMKFTVLGGMHVPYGMVYDSDNSMVVAYSDLAMKFGKYGAKLKVYNDEDVTKAGFDFYGRTGSLRYSANYGHDITDNQIADGGLSMLYMFNRKLNFSGNYRLFRTMPWSLGHTEFETYLIERFLVGAGYRIFDNYTLNLRQMVTMTSDNSDYMSYVTIGHKYFTAGISYLTGDSGIRKTGIILAGNYTIIKGLNISGGIAPVDYLMQDQDDHLMSIAYYARIKYRVLKSLCLKANFDFYQFDETYDDDAFTPVLQAGLRAGLQLTYYFGS